MKSYRLINNLTGWIVFAVAAVVYLLTIEPSASFWDCPEFITTGYKLEVGHPPGAPFFMLTANLFSQFVNDPTQVARMVNAMSALLSAGCILFLFWSITHLTKKLVCRDEEQMSAGKLVTIMGAGIVGALAYTFSDTFWFSAVEGEVYAYSSFFTAIVFWFILKWEDVADTAYADRWLILIAYMVGLSVGVHLLNLLCIPAIVLVWYFKKKPNATFWGTILALVVSAVLIAIVLYGIVPGIVKVGGWFELLFVNGLHLPFNTGLIIYIVVLVACLVWSIVMTYKENKTLQKISFLLSVALLGIPFFGHGTGSVLIGLVILGVLAYVLFFFKKDYTRLMNTALICLTVMVVGYSSYALIVIRSTANTPMDQNSPEDIFTLGDYLGREQYGQTPLFYGQTYASKVKWKVDGRYCVPETKKGAPIYGKKEKTSPDEKDRYIVVSNRDKYIYAQNMVFPRMYSEPHSHYGAQQVNLYDQWVPGGIKGKKVSYDYCGEKQTLTIPTMTENLAFFFNYQVNFMYWRYFLWNFVGRQNDICSYGEIEHGNWITGFNFIDKYLVGDQTLLPTELKENKGRNVFYGLPLLLGLIGLCWQAFRRGKRGAQQFWVVFFLFFMTGLAIVLYLNQTPQQPRERDYAYAGSFYAFTIWIGLAVAAVSEWLKKLFKKNDLVPAVLATLVCILVPIQMGSQTWDDHDRSHRYMCRDFGQNYLNTLPDQGYPIIYTNGDNDTFPLWYNQDTEGFRTDARVCNLSYLGTDWYIDQMVRPAYDSPSLPITWPRLKYVSGTNDAVPIAPSMKQEVLNYYEQYPDEARKNYGDDPFELKNIMKYWVLTDNDELHFIPTDTVYITIDKDAVRRSGMLIQNDTIPDRMAISLTGMRQLDKSKLMMLEMLANANWERPLYVAMTVGGENTMNLDNHFVQEGLCYRITPYNVNEPGFTNFDTERTYDNVMNRFKFGGVDKPGIYLDETVMRMCYTHRSLMVILAMQLKKEGDNLMEQDSIVTEAAQLKYDKAIKVLDKMEKELPSYNVPYDMYAFYAAGIYVDLGQPEKAKPIYDYLWKRADQYVEFYCSFTGRQFLSYEDQCRRQFSLMSSIAGDYEAIDSGKAMAMVTLLKKRFSEFSEKQALYESQLQGE